METVTLSRIVMRLTPELVPYLTRRELESQIVLRDGLQALDAGDVMEIVQFSISEHQKDAILQ
ncbi:hypothetical protein ABNB59_09020 [Paenibacillus larvae]|uniref:Uncharacterized protein n=3 Tax=Paenibacillus larvae TaxID=1464 RepID=V9W4Y7_9BACL|nr:hypothetical protein [Paenibacillus larvae]AHD05014.1 hypothetical protein ERIC2_c11830 [Paenibacillus larvae subsp. larvae DSM 25430]AVF20855.1 hypothetical protein ERICI_00946 [Paenibacillus larvae subsp. larvae]AVG11561.1 hypothetical protein ERICII_01146 [Paenibacillus larvae subsp. larvae DSM 25430]ETK28178.1 hypothetical protein ERIC1_1c16380 [Paenibacillus larvae subsp. larvae DSM 25719]MCY7476942.1 hypothetical protein [Paenibacillus larvae]